MPSRARPSPGHVWDPSKARSFERDAYSWAGYLLEDVAPADSASPGLIGSDWRIVVIEEGPSANRGNLTGSTRWYAKEALESMIPLLEGITVHAYEFESSLGRFLNHKPGSQIPSTIGNGIGWLSGLQLEQVMSVRRPGRQVWAITADFHIAETAAKYRTYLREGWERGVKELAGFSIVAAGREVPEVLEDGRLYDVVRHVRHVESLDLVSSPAAGGRLERLVASEEEFMDKALRELLGRLPASFREGVTDQTNEAGLIAKLTVFSEGDSMKLADALGDRNITLRESNAIRQALQLVQAGDRDGALKALKAMLDNPDMLKASTAPTPTPTPTPRAVDPTPTPTPTPAVDPTLHRQVEGLTNRLDEALKGLSDMGRKYAVTRLQVRLGETELPEAFKTRALASAMKEATLTEDRAEEILKNQLDFYEECVKTGVVARSAGTKESLVESGVTHVERLQGAIDMVMEADQFWTDAERAKYAGMQGLARPRKISPLYLESTGDYDFSGQTQKDRMPTDVYAVLQESITTASFPSMLGNSIRRRMAGDYEREAMDWRKVVRVVRAEDFRTVEVVRWGGYGDLPGVNQGAAYQPLSSPTDEKATYAVSKRGGTEDVTIEAVRDDDLRGLRDIGPKLSRAAARTLNRFVFNMIKNRTTLWNDGTIYDTLALGHANHGGNLLTAPYGYAAHWAARKVMRKQKEKDSLEPLGLMPKILVCSIDNEDVAMIVRDTEKVPGGDHNDNNALRGTFEIVANDYVSEGDSGADNWILMADPQRTHINELAFLDGKETPDLLIQNQPTVGTVFTNDKITYLVKHIYGGAIVDWRGFVISIVGAN